MLSDKEVVMLWRRLFRGQRITSETIIRAEGLLEELGPESPLKIRLAKELSEIKSLTLKNASGK